VIITYTAKYTKIRAGYMGQVVEWPEVITEGKTIEECKEMLRDALGEMLLAYRQQNKEIPKNPREAGCVNADLAEERAPWTASKWGSASAAGG